MGYLQKQKSLKEWDAKDGKQPPTAKGGKQPPTVETVDPKEDEEAEDRKNYRSPMDDTPLKERDEVTKHDEDDVCSY